MTIIVASQAYIFLCTVAGGVAIALIYDLFRIRRKAVKAGNIITYVEDLLFWLIVAVIVFSVVTFSNDGELRGYVFLGTALGVILYMLLLSKIVMSSAMFLIHIVVRIVRFLWMILSYPFRLLFRAFSVPVRFIVLNLSKTTNFARRAGRNKFSGTLIWRRMLKNIRKKI